MRMLMSGLMRIRGGGKIGEMGKIDRQIGSAIIDLLEIMSQKKLDEQSLRDGGVTFVNGEVGK
jgi:hypothetical protein